MGVGVLGRRGVLVGMAVRFSLDLVSWYNRIIIIIIIIILILFCHMCMFLIRGECDARVCLFVRESMMS